MMLQLISLTLLITPLIFGMDVSSSGLKSEFSVKCLGIMQPLLQDLTVKKEKIDKCDNIIQSREKALTEVQGKCDQLQIKLAVSEAVVREKDRQLLDQHDLYTSHKNNSLVKDELLKAYRLQVASSEETIKAKSDRIELLLKEAQDREKELRNCKSKLDQLEALDQANKLQQEANEAQVQKLLADARETTIQLENQTIELRSKSEQLQELQAEKQWQAIQVDELKTNLTDREQQLGILQVEAQKLSDQLSTFKQEVETTNVQIEGKSATLNEKQTVIDQLELKLNSTNTKFEELKTNLSNKEQQLETLQMENQKLSDQLSTCKKEVETTNVQLEAKNSTLNEKQTVIDQLELKLSSTNTKFEELKTNFSNKEQQLKTLQVETQKLPDQLSTCKSQVETINSQLEVKNTTLNNNQAQIDQMQRDLDSSKSNLSECRRKIDTLQSTNCFWFGNSSDIHEIRAPGISPFDVLCDSQLAGQGWTVIQRRINGSENFYRNWTDYRNGFGSLHGEFFIGLEKLHRMTTASTYELYVHIETFDNNTFYARYTEFSIGSEKESYYIKLLGAYTGNAGDSLYYNRNRKFSTFDADNDRDDKNCAELKHGGWWYDRCGHSNLNGEYMIKSSKFGKGIYWLGVHSYSLKAVQMMVRPKSAQYFYTSNLKADN